MIIINIICLISIFLAIDMICYIKNISESKSYYVFENPIRFFKFYINTYKRMFYTSKEYDNAFIEGDSSAFTDFPQPINTESPKSPILIMGCSFARGIGLEPKQSFMGKLAKYTDRPVYNRAISGRGVNEMLYQLRSEKFYSAVPKPEWFIYVLIPDHLRRAQIPNAVFYLGTYYDENLNMKRNINIPIMYALKSQLPLWSDEKYSKHFLDLLLEMKNEAQKHWNDGTKYLILFYDNEDDLYTFLKPKLEENGYLVFSINDLTDKDLMTPEYKTSDNVHPSEKAWDIITPALIEKAGI